VTHGAAAASVWRRGSDGGVAPTPHAEHPLAAATSALSAMECQSPDTERPPPHPDLRRRTRNAIFKPSFAGGVPLSRPSLQIEITRPDRPSEVVPIGRTPYAIGSDPGADLRLQHPGVLPQHARVVLVGGTYHLLPEPASPGMSVDGTPIPRTGVSLSHGTSVALLPHGAVSLRFLDTHHRSPDREDRLVTLMEIARTITDSLNVDEVLGRVLDGAVRFSGAQRGYLFLREGERLIPWTRGPAPPNDVEVSLSVVEEVARTGSPVYRDHLQDSTAEVATRSMVRLRLQAILCVPLAVRQDVIGVVYLDSQRVLPDHRPDLPLLEALAGLAAVAIQNSRLVEQRLRAERMLVIGQMASAIVHDLRSPLASIGGLAELLLHRCPERDPSRHHLETMISETHRLAQLTGDLLHFTKQAPPLNQSDVRLADLICDTLTPFKPRLQQGSIALNLALDEDACAAVDAPRIVRALHNLVANAVDAMPDGGTLTLRCEREDEHALLKVGDTGCGMTEEVRLRLFEPFFSHGKRHGTGLGLAIVRSIIDEHKGCIDVESMPGRGTTVTLSLPARPPLQDGTTLH
jgi:signal transduction histidine kinase